MEVGVAAFREPHRPTWPHKIVKTCSPSLPKTEDSPEVPREISNLRMADGVLSKCWVLQRYSNFGALPRLGYSPPRSGRHLPVRGSFFVKLTLPPHDRTLRSMDGSLGA